MSSSTALSAINKIHINNSTKMSLSDRFTAFCVQPKIQPRTSRRGVDSPVSRAASIANRRLLKQLAQKHTREAALKLKRRSMKQRPPTAAHSRASNGVPLTRGSVKALRLGPNGRLMKANSITNVATMEADFLGRPPRRSNSASRISERMGARRNEALRGGGGGGGGAHRVGRPTWRPNSQMNFDRPPPPRMRSRSRSRTRRAVAVLSPPSSRNPGIGQRMARQGRSNSRPRTLIRSRSRSGRIDRMGRMMDVRAAESVPITSRLGLRPTALANRARSASRGGAGGRRPMREGVASGRIQKRRNSVRPVTASGASLAGNVKSRISRRGRYDPQRSAPPANQRLNAQIPKPRGNAARGRARSRSRTDNRPLQRNNNGAIRGGAANRQRGATQTARGRGGARGGGRRGRSQQRGGAVRNGAGQQQQQQRRGRSRSRGRGSARGGRQLAKDKPDVKKEDLDKELDQYMSSTKTTDGLFS